MLRYQRVDADVDSPEAFLARTVTRLCLDALKSARRRRETLTLMVALERLSPLERAAFLLHDVFEVGLDEVAATPTAAASAARRAWALARARAWSERDTPAQSARAGAHNALAPHAARSRPRYSQTLAPPLSSRPELPGCATIASAIQLRFGSPSKRVCAPSAQRQGLFRGRD